MKAKTNIITSISVSPIQGRIQDFKLGGGVHLRKLRRAEGGTKIFGVFHVKNYDFMPKKNPILGGGCTRSAAPAIGLLGRTSCDTSNRVCQDIQN